MKKKFLSLLLVLTLAVGLCAPAYANSDYGAIYDETELLDMDQMEELGNSLLPEMSDLLEVDLRVDILTTIGDFASVAEAGNYLYQNFGYGYGEAGNAVTLTLLVTPSEAQDDLVLEDWYLMAAGDDEELIGSAPAVIGELIGDYLTEDAWSGDLESDEMMLVQAINVMAAGAQQAVQSGGASEPLPGGSEDDWEQDLFPEDEIDAMAAQDLPAFEPGVYVYDTAGVLSEEEAAALNEQCAAASGIMECDVYACTIENFETLDYDVVEAAKTWYMQRDMGQGDSKSGEMLLLSMENRKFALIAYGNGNDIFTDFGKKYMRTRYLDDFREDDWAAGFEHYVEVSAEMLEMAADGHPLEKGTLAKIEPSARVAGVAGTAVIALIIAFIVRMVLMNQLKSVAKQTEAAAYAKDGGLQLNDQYDRFTHTTQSRIYDPPKESHNSGGSSVDSDGFSSDSGDF